MKQSFNAQFLKLIKSTVFLSVIIAFSSSQIFAEYTKKTKNEFLALQAYEIEEMADRDEILKHLEDLKVYIDAEESLEEKRFDEYENATGSKAKKLNASYLRHYDNKVKLNNSLALILEHLSKQK